MNLLILAKEPHIRKSCFNAAAYSGISVTAVDTAQEAMVIMDASDVDILVADLKLCESGGLNIIRRVQDTKPEMAVIGLNGRGKIDSAVISSLLGILHFIAKCRHGLPRTISPRALST